MRRLGGLARAALIVFTTVGSACSQILSIEEAHVDPTLSDGQGGSAQSGRSGASASMAGSESPNETASGGTHGHGDGASGESGSTASAGTSTSSAGGAPPDEPEVCERYCDQVTRACKGKYEQYRSFDQCVNVCKRLPPGEAGDRDKNSVSCRLRQAELAESEPFVYCKSAGPLGEGKCGSNCITYCDLMQKACTAESTAGNLELSYFATSQACLADCAELPETTDSPVHYSSSVSAEPSSYVGNTVFCRTYHVAAALEQDTPDEHCPHAMGGDPCTD